MTEVQTSIPLVIIPRMPTKISWVVYIRDKCAASQSNMLKHALRKLRLRLLRPPSALTRNYYENIFLRIECTSDPQNCLDLYTSTVIY